MAGAVALQCTWRSNATAVAEAAESQISGSRERWPSVEPVSGPSTENTRWNLKMLNSVAEHKGDLLECS